MRTLAFLLLLNAALSPQDEKDIRSLIEEQAKKDSRTDGQIWSERGPLAYRVRQIQPLTSNVATADVDGVRAGAFPSLWHYTFILTRTQGRWTIVRRIPVCGYLRIQPIDGAPPCSP